MKAAVCLVVSILILKVSSRCDSYLEVCGLGEGFFLPSLSLVEDNGNGKSIFKSLNPSCVKKVPSLINREEKTFFENTESFYSKLAVDTGLSGAVTDGFTLGASILAASSSIDSKTIDVKGIGIDVYAITSFWNILPDCLTTAPLDEEFLQAFEKLPSKVAQPQHSTSWYEYDAFLQTYGSHVAKRISSGSKLTRYVFSKSSEKISSEEFHIKACASLKEASNTIQGCSNFTQADYDRVATLATSEDLTVRGGSTETRAKLMVNVTDELLETFLKEANLTEQPAALQYHSIWDLLKSRYLGSEHFVKAMNLQAYYLGYLATGCQLMTDNNVELRKFVLVEDDPNVPAYECQLAPRGCRGDNDCHIGGALSVCYCYAPGCVDSHKTPDPRHNLQKGRYVKKHYDGSSTWEGVNWSCHYQAGVYCTCEKTWGGSWETVWPTESNYKENLYFLRSAQQKLRKFNRV